MNKEEQIEKDWDIYWSAQNNSSNAVYDVIANFYRNNIIRPYLNGFLTKHFQKGQKVLHAGCGSGKVDVNIVNYLSITALDISRPALEIYKKVNGNKATVIQGNIFSLPFSEETFDGIYDLGVIEHFTEEEIQEILLEFKRVLRPGGKIVLFIPPVFGLTVQVLDFAHFFLNKILRRNVKLHPDEITRIKSKQHIKELIEKAGFKFIEYYFGPKDLFTQIVIVGSKA
ncbi:MAG TPA: methyltransferase domain-containing protein [Cytophagaceae bacterium]|nr:methyltransferase domain-containing protein [Cytophagaceae bacterium]